MIASVSAVYCYWLAELPESFSSCLCNRGTCLWGRRKAVTQRLGALDKPVECGRLSDGGYARRFANRLKRKRERESGTLTLESRRRERRGGMGEGRVAEPALSA